MKLFNSMLVYRLTQPLDIDPTGLSDELGRLASREPATHELRTLGFVEPIGIEGEYVELVVGLRSRSGNPDTARWLTVRVIERQLPGKAIRKAVDDRVKEIRKAEGRIVRGREKQEIKDDIVMAMLPRAFTVSSDINVLLTEEFIFIDQTSRSKAEDALQLIREALGSLPCVPLHTVMNPGTMMSAWAHNGHTGTTTLRIGNSFKLEDVFEGGSTLSGSHLDLSETDSELLSNLSEGRAVTELGLTLSDDKLDGEMQLDIAFTLTDQYVVKGIKWPSEFLDIAAEELGDDDSDYSAERVNMMLVFSGLHTILHRLVDELGGINEGMSISEAFSEKATDDGSDLI